MSDQLNADLAVWRGLLQFTGTNEEDQRSHSAAYSQRNLDTVHGGLNGTARTAAVFLGQARDTDLSQAFDGVRRLAEAGELAFRTYLDTGEEAEIRFKAHNFGTMDVIAPNWRV